MSQRKTEQKKRKRNVRDDGIEEVQEEISAELGSEVFINKTFLLYRCTPFYRFEQTNFTQYGKELHNFITGQILNRISLDCDTGEENDFISEGKVVELFISKIKLSGWNGTNGMPIGIMMKFKPKGSAREQIFHLIFLPSIVSREFVHENLPFNHYPVILIKAPQRLANIVIEWFETRFDCRICRYRLQSSYLKKFVELLANISDDFIQTKPLELTYTISDISEIKNIKLRISLVDIKRLYNRLKEKPAVSQQRSSDITEGIEEHFFECLRIKLSSLILSKIGNNAALVAGEGKLKIFAGSLSSTLTTSFLKQLVMFTQ